VRVNLGKGLGLFLTFFFSPFLSLSHSCFCSSCRLLLRGGTIGGCWNSDSKSGEFEYQPFCFQITTNLAQDVHSYIHVSLSPSDIISVPVNGQARKVHVVVCLSWPCVTYFVNLSSIQLRVQGLRNRDEHPAYTSLWVGLYGTLCVYLGITVLLIFTHNFNTHIEGQYTSLMGSQAQTLARCLMKGSARNCLWHLTSVLDMATRLLPTFGSCPV